MFCTSCGTPIQPNQAICSKCGSPTSIGIMHGGGRRVADHYKLLGILHIVYSSFIAIAGFAAVIIGKVIFGWMWQFMPHNGPPPPPFVGVIIQLVGWVILARAGAGLAAGIGLLQRASWARVLTLVMGFLSLVSIPFGTALGIYTIWVLLGAGADQEYERLSAAA
jgi:predicted nucleic acid-binding Zn ribbon protein